MEKLKNHVGKISESPRRFAYLILLILTSATVTNFISCNSVESKAQTQEFPKKEREKKSTIDYSKASNILDPDTLTDDRKSIYEYFKDWTFEQMDTITPREINIALTSEVVGIMPKQEYSRYKSSISFFQSLRYHKKSVENWYELMEILDIKE